MRYFLLLAIALGAVTTAEAQRVDLMSNIIQRSYTDQGKIYNGGTLKVAPRVMTPEMRTGNQSRIWILHKAPLLDMQTVSNERVQLDLPMGIVPMGNGVYAAPNMQIRMLEKAGACAHMVFRMCVLNADRTANGEAALQLQSRTVGYSASIHGEHGTQTPYAVTVHSSKAESIQRVWMADKDGNLWGIETTGPTENAIVQGSMTEAIAQSFRLK